MAAALITAGLSAVLHTNDDHANPSLLPLPYLLLLLGTDTGVTATVATTRRIRQKKRRRSLRQLPPGGV